MVNNQQIITAAIVAVSPAFVPDNAAADLPAESPLELIYDTITSSVVGPTFGMCYLVFLVTMSMEN